MKTREVVGFLILALLIALVYVKVPIVTDYRIRPYINYSLILAYGIAAGMVLNKLIPNWKGGGKFLVIRLVILTLSTLLVTLVYQWFSHQHDRLGAGYMLFFLGSGFLILFGFYAFLEISFLFLKNRTQLAFIDLIIIGFIGYVWLLCGLFG